MDWSPLVVSLKISGTATAFVFVLGIVAARAVSRSRGIVRVIADGFFSFSVVLPPTVVGFALLAAFGRRSPAGKLLALFGIRLVFSWWGAVLAAFVVAFPLMYRTARSAFDHIDPSLSAAARTLGMSEWRIFRLITLPLAWPGIAAGVALSFARALGEFGATLMIAGNIPGKTQTIPVAIYFLSEGGFTGRALVWVAVILAVSLVSMTVVNATERRRH